MDTHTHLIAQAIDGIQGEEKHKQCITSYINLGDLNAVRVFVVKIYCEKVDEKKKN
jgi:hypothetical protein